MRVHKRAVIKFYLLALGISWAGWLPFAAAQVGLLPLTVPWEIPLLAQFGPTLAAFLVTGWHEGLGGTRALLSQAFRWRFPIRWYLVAILMTPTIAAGWLIFHALIGDPTPGWDAVKQWPGSYAESFGGGGVYAIDATPHPSLGPIAWLRKMVNLSPWLAALNFLVFCLLTGPISEEFGWRGWLLPRMQHRWSALKASILVGLLWGFWHTGPDFWRMLLGGDARAFLYPLAMTIGTIPLSIIFCSLYNNTGASLVTPMLFHASFNATLSVLGLVWGSRSPLLIGAELVLGLWVLAAFIIVRWGGDRLAIPEQVN